MGGYNVRLNIHLVHLGVSFAKTVNIKKHIFDNTQLEGGSIGLRDILEPDCRSTKGLLNKQEIAKNLHAAMLNMHNLFICMNIHA